MILLKPESMRVSLQEIWEGHQDYVWRVVVSLAKDIDLAEDVLQDTYVRACAGFDGYRGGDPKAWLTAIAKNVFFSGARRKYFSAEVALDTDAPATDGVPGSSDHITSVLLRQAIAVLPDAMRQSLIMKHYGGLTYSEIARSLNCKQGTAQRRVFEAIRRLRAALEIPTKEFEATICRGIPGSKLIDYIYGNLSDTDSVRRHLESCARCRAEVDETIALLRMLDNEESAFRVTNIHTPDHSYTVAVYPVEFVQSAQEQQHTLGFGHSGELEPIYATLGGDEVIMHPFRAEPDGPVRGYIPELPRQAAPGELVEVLLVTSGTKPRSKSKGDTVRFTSCTENSYDSICAVILQLVEGATVTRTDPEPADIRTSNGRTTVYFRRFAPAGQQLEWNVDYIL